jgi:hypothetical protein
MNRRRALGASIASLALAALAACSYGSTGGSSSGGSNPNPGSSYCVPESGNCGGPQISANPQPTNQGVGHVSGICHFSLTSPAGSKGDGGSGLKPKKSGPVLITLSGIVWGYCTDTVRDFTLDLHIYGGPPGTHTTGTDFTKNKRAHELSYREVKSPIPGPVPTPYAITMPCIPGLELQLVYTVTARDQAGNFIGGGPYGGSIVQYTAKDCGAAK